VALRGDGFDVVVERWKRNPKVRGRDLGGCASDAGEGWGAGRKFVCCGGGVEREPRKKFGGGGPPKDRKTSGGGTEQGRNLLTMKVVALISGGGGNSIGGTILGAKGNGRKGGILYIQSID